MRNVALSRTSEAEKGSPATGVVASFTDFTDLRLQEPTCCRLSRGTVIDRCRSRAAAAEQNHSPPSYFFLLLIILHLRSYKKGCVCVCESDSERV